MKLRLLSLIAIGVISSGGWYFFGNLRPKNVKQYLEWSGFKLLSWEDKKSWDAVLEENKGWLADVVGSSPDIEKIKQWCRDVLLKENYEQYSKHASLLCVDNLQTVKGKIIQKSGSLKGLIQDTDSDADKKYKISFLFRKHIDGFKALIGYVTPSPTKEDEPPKENLKDAYEKLKSWCNSSLNQKPNEALISNVEIFCSPKKFKTISELIKLNGETLLTDPSKMKELNEKHEKIKDLDSFKKDQSLKFDRTQVKSLSSWCCDMKDKEFSKDGVFEDYPKFRFRCVSTKERSQSVVS